MKGFISVVYLIFGTLMSLSQCTNSNLNFTDAILTDTNQHNSGGHSASTGFYDVSSPTPPGNQHVVGTCTYTDAGNGAANCNTSCSVQFTSGSSTSERGTLNSTGTHQVYQNWVSGQSAASGGGTACTGGFGGGTANCGPGGCQASVGITVTVNGQNATASFGGLAGATPVWVTASPFPLSCPVRQVHPNGGGSGGGCTPNPGSATSPGPVGYSVQYDPNNPPDPCSVSPIIIDTEGEGFHLTSADSGVTFDITGTGHPVQMGWTDPQFHNAFLALPGSDGLVHNGKQLFGNYTPQPPSAHPNGFLALAEFDKPENGGNGDGIIDEKDAVYSRLRLWIDENHDGISQPNELRPLSELGVYSLALNYFESRRTDQFGDLFRYKAKVDPDARRDPRDVAPPGDPGRWAYDVFFLTK